MPIGATWVGSDLNHGNQIAEGHINKNVLRDYSIAREAERTDVRTSKTNKQTNNHANTSQSESTPKELTRNLNSLCKVLNDDQGIHIEPEDVEDCLRNKKIELLTQNEFDMIVKDFPELLRETQLKHNFRFFDKNNDGQISRKEWKTAVKTLCEKGIFPVNLSRSEQKAMFKAADTDNNKKISFEEYETMARKETKVTKPVLD